MGQPHFECQKTCFTIAKQLIHSSLNYFIHSFLHFLHSFNFISFRFGSFHFISCHFFNSYNMALTSTKKTCTLTDPQKPFPMINMTGSITKKQQLFGACNDEPLQGQHDFHYPGDGSKVRLKLSRCGLQKATSGTSSNVQKTTNWWLNQPIWKICDSQNGCIFPKVWGENLENVWNHQLDNLETTNGFMEAIHTLGFGRLTPPNLSNLSTWKNIFWECSMGSIGSMGIFTCIKMVDFSCCSCR